MVAAPAAAAPADAAVPENAPAAVPADAAPGDAQAAPAQPAAPAAAPEQAADTAAPMEQDPPPAAETPGVPAPPPVSQDAPPPPPPEPPKELEENATDITGKTITSQVGFNTEDTTLNVVPAHSGALLMMLTDGGMQYLLAGARANVGIKAGRYLFEVKILEVLDPQDSQGPHARVVQPKNLLRLGFATSSSSLLLGETEDSVCFDSEGFFTQSKTRVQATQRFGRDQVLGLLLNLDAGSANANTVSFFRDGARVSQPMPLPEALKGKTLFPAVTFRNVTLSFNFGPTPKAELPFKCHMLGKAAEQDVEVLPGKQPKDGKFEVIFPVLLPEEGSFDWVDLFLQQHPDFTELSDRMILDWCEKSGIQRNRGYRWRTSNDRPDMQMNVPELDNLSIRRALRSIAPAQRRSFLVVELKSNLLAAERKELISRFAAPHFKRLAQVMVGDPTADFKKRTQELLLKQKQEKVNAEFEQQQAEEIRKHLADKREKELQRAAKKARKEAAEAARQAEVERRAAAGEEPLKDEEMRPAEEADEPDQPMPDPAEAKPPAATLTEAEMTVVFRPAESPDVSDWVLAKCLNDLVLPEKSEGFDNVTYSWSARGKAEAYFKEWKLTKKLTTRVDDLVVGEWLNTKLDAWKEILSTWRQRQSIWKAGSAKKEKAQEEPEPEVPEVPVSEATVEEVKPAEPKDEPMTTGVADEDFDVFGVADVLDVGNGEPLCSQFSWEDWILLSLRVELYLMVHSFRKDCTDPDRPGIHVDNVPFYYNRYFRKTFAANHYGFEANEKVIDLVKDTVSLGERNMLTPELGEELDNFDLFLKLTEEGRRERDLNIDLGEDEAILKFNQAVLMSQLPIPGGSQNNKGYQKGKEKGYQDQKGGKGKPGGWPMQGYDGKGFGWGGGGKGCMGPMGQMGPGGGGCKGGMPPGKGKFNNFGKGYMK